MQSCPIAGASDGADLWSDGVRIGIHETYERVVFDFEGGSIPDVSTSWTDEATDPMSDTVHEVGGDDLLRIQMDGVSVPYNGEVSPAATGIFASPQTSAVDEVLYLGSFEGTVPAYIGLDERRPYRVFTLHNPTRVVVDIQTT